VRSFFGFCYGITAFTVGCVIAFVIGGVAVLPFVVVPRGKRERYTMRSAALWADIVVRGLLLSRPRVTGSVELPDGQGALFLCNHRSWLDPLLMISVTRSQGLSKAAIFWIPFVGIYAWLTGAVFFDRSSMKQRQRARREVMWMIGQGGRIHAFPEGTRSKDGTIASKVFLTLPNDCFAAGIPVIPCAVHGTERTLPATATAAFPGQPCRLDIGKPLHPKDFPDARSFADACWGDVVRRVEALNAEDRLTVA
jgi:1-acyl-sn-glycerol-3-phosphate acyltransferase